MLRSTRSSIRTFILSPIFSEPLFSIGVRTGPDGVFFIRKSFLIIDKGVESYYEGKLNLPRPTGELQWELLGFFIGIFMGMVINGFYGAIIGMGYDIMVSGDEFAQFRNLFHYIKKYWFKYFIIGFIVNLLVSLIPFFDFAWSTVQEFMRLLYIVYSLQLIVYVFFYILNPALIVYPSFSNAIKNTVKIFYYKVK